jgi:hypothetical protein
MNNVARLLAAALLSLSAAPSIAASIAIANPSFEENFAPDGGFPVFPAAVGPTGWSVYDPGSILNGNLSSIGVLNPTGTTFYSTPVPDGRNVAIVFLQDSPGEGPAGVRQFLSATLQADTRYTLSVAIGNIASGTGLGPYAGFGFTNLSGFPGYQVEVLAGGIQVALDDNSLGTSLADGSFGLSTLVFDGNARPEALGQTLEIRLINLNLTGTATAPGIEVNFDNVQLTTSPVPEPASWAMLAAGLASVMLWRRRLARI